MYQKCHAQYAPVSLIASNTSVGSKQRPNMEQLMKTKKATALFLLIQIQQEEAQHLLLQVKYHCLSLFHFK